MPTVPLTDAQRVDARRFAGYEAYGSGNAGFQGWRFFQAYGTLEYKLTNITDAEAAVLLTYLATLNTLEAAIITAAANLDTDQAAVWTHNKNEIGDRSKLYDGWRRRLCGFLGIPPGAVRDAVIGLAYGLIPAVLVVILLPGALKLLVFVILGIAAGTGYMLGAATD